MYAFFDRRECVITNTEVWVIWKRTSICCVTMLRPTTWRDLRWTPGEHHVFHFVILLTPYIHALCSFINHCRSTRIRLWLSLYLRVQGRESLQTRNRTRRWAPATVIMAAEQRTSLSVQQVRASTQSQAKGFRWSVLIFVFLATSEIITSSTKEGEKRGQQQNDDPEAPQWAPQWGCRW